jgi:hypothetical protein
MDYLGTNNPIQRTYNSNTLEGNWFEDRCRPKYDEDKKRNLLLKSANAWQYDTTYNELNKKYSNFQKTQTKFNECNENYINFQPKNNSMYITTNK